MLRRKRQSKLLNKTVSANRRRRMLANSKKKSLGSSPCVCSVKQLDTSRMANICIDVCQKITAHSFSQHPFALHHVWL